MFLDPAKITVFPKPLYNVVEQHSVFLNCHGTGNPSPTVIWRNANMETVPGNSTLASRFKILENGDLLINPVRKNDTGTFTCKLSNEIGYPELATTELQVYCEKIN